MRSRVQRRLHARERAGRAGRRRYAAGRARRHPASDDTAAAVRPFVRSFARLFVARLSGLVWLFVPFVVPSCSTGGSGGSTGTESTDSPVRIPGGALDEPLFLPKPRSAIAHEVIRPAPSERAAAGLGARAASAGSLRSDSAESVPCTHAGSVASDVDSLRLPSGRRPKPAGSGKPLAVSNPPKPALARRATMSGAGVGTGKRPS